MQITNHIYFKNNGCFICIQKRGSCKEFLLRNSRIQFCINFIKKLSHFIKMIK